MDVGKDFDILNTLLCDELVAEIFSRIHSAIDRKNIRLVCKRWLIVEAIARTKLGICIPANGPISCFYTIHGLLRRYCSITSLVLDSEGEYQTHHGVDIVLDVVAANCHFLEELHVLGGPASDIGLRALAKGCPAISVLELVSLDPKHLPLLSEFAALRELSLTRCHNVDEFDLLDVPCGNLQVQRLTLEGISARNTGLGWLWRSCSKLSTLEFFGCQGIGDNDPSSLIQCLLSLEELRLRRCRCIANQVLLLAAEVCSKLKTLVFMDGGDTIGLHEIMRSCKALQVLELRLPLDLFNADLGIIAQNCSSLRSLRLYSCWMATGAGFRTLGSQLRCNLEELVLVRCRAIVQDMGTLAYLGQDLKYLQSLDVSENDHLADRELMGMLASICQRLCQLRLRRCRKLTDNVMEFIGQRCHKLQNLVITSCDGVTHAGVLLLLRGCPNLKRIWVEKDKLTPDVRRLASEKRVFLPGIEPGFTDFDR